MPQLNLDGGEDRQVALAQYDTPPALAARQVAMIVEGRSWWQDDALPRGARVLEPSAGEGALVRALLAKHPRVYVRAVELDDARASKLEAFRESIRDGSFLTIECADYLALHAPAKRYDLALSNPPFSRGMEVAHIAKMLDESERAILQLPIRSLHGQARMREVWKPRIGKTHWIRREVRVEERAYPNASDDVVLIDVQRVEGPCELAWWCP